ncbi:hypothetical protein PR048_009998 [Dryococelus australis]|uniref:Uncharacterized protein n=1 Tax=Dryococelus australis TaxID=614101 RepID=A0ABQ9I1F9_9NEOP|nr:hypothetical protein PR048_009998 [Dryococelus australis]
MGTTPNRIEPGSSWWEENSLTTTPLWSRQRTTKAIRDGDIKRYNYLVELEQDSIMGDEVISGKRIIENTRFGPSVFPNTSPVLTMLGAETSCLTLAIRQSVCVKMDVRVVSRHKPWRCATPQTLKRVSSEDDPSLAHGHALASFRHVGFSVWCRCVPGCSRRHHLLAQQKEQVSFFLSVVGFLVCCRLQPPVLRVALTGCKLHHLRLFHYSLCPQTRIDTQHPLRQEVGECSSHENTQEVAQTSDKGRSSKSTGTSAKSKRANKDAILDKAVNIMNTTKDDCHIFGEFVASSLRTINNVQLINELKKKIRKDIMSFMDIEDSLSDASAYPIHETTSPFAECVGDELGKRMSLHTSHLTSVLCDWPNEQQPIPRRHGTDDRLSSAAGESYTSEASCTRTQGNGSCRSGTSNTGKCRFKRRLHSSTLPRCLTISIGPHKRLDGSAALLHHSRRKKLRNANTDGLKEMDQRHSISAGKPSCSILLRHQRFPQHATDVRVLERPEFEWRLRPQSLGELRSGKPCATLDPALQLSCSADSEEANRLYLSLTPHPPSELIPSSYTEQDGPNLLLPISPHPPSQLIPSPDSDQDGPTPSPSPQPPSDLIPLPDSEQATSMPLPKPLPSSPSQLFPRQTPHSQHLTWPLCHSCSKTQPTKHSQQTP